MLPIGLFHQCSWKSQKLYRTINSPLQHSNGIYIIIVIESTKAHKCSHISHVINITSSAKVRVISLIVALYIKWRAFNYWDCFFVVPRSGYFATISRCIEKTTKSKHSSPNNSHESFFWTDSPRLYQ